METLVFDKKTAKPSWPWKIIYLYTKTKEYKLVGWGNHIHNFIDDLQEPYIYYQVFYKNGKRGFGEWILRTNEKYKCIKIYSPNNSYHCSRSNPNKQRRRHFLFKEGYNEKGKILLKLRKIPRKWIPEYDEIIKQLQ